MILAIRNICTADRPKYLANGDGAYPTGAPGREGYAKGAKKALKRSAHHWGPRKGKQR